MFVIVHDQSDKQSDKWEEDFLKLPQLFCSFLPAEGDENFWRPTKIGFDKRLRENLFFSIP